MWGLTFLQSQFFLVPFAEVLLPCHLSTGTELVAGRQRVELYTVFSRGRNRKEVCAKAGVETGMNKAHCLSGKTFPVITPCVKRESLQGLRKQSCRKQMDSSGLKGTDCSTCGCAQACS